MDKQLAIFVVLVSLASIGASIAVATSGGADSPLVMPLALFVMWAPALAVYASTRLTLKSVGPLGFRHFSILLLPVAILTLPVVANVMGFGAVLALVGEVPWHSWLTPDAGGLIHPPEGGKWGAEPFASDALLTKIVVKAAVGALIVTFFALGEEIGWRAFFLPRLQQRFGMTRGVLYVAVIWALWHTPYAISGMHDVPGVSRVLLVLVMPPGHLGFGLFLGWLWTRTKSVWLVAIAHGVTNNWAGLALQFVDADTHAGPILAAVNGGYFLVGLGFLALLARGESAEDAPSTDESE